VDTAVVLEEGWPVECADDVGATVGCWMTFVLVGSEEAWNKRNMMVLILRNK
jgi:hypothetical protein